MADERQPYRLYYWPGLPGRGEFVRLVLEQAGAEYEDVARRPAEEGGGVPAVVAAIRGEQGGMRPFAPPILVDGELVLAQAPNICAYLAARHGLVPKDEPSRALAMQVALTIADLVAEAHDTHHPVATSKYYADQVDEAKSAAREFVEQRMPKFLRYFEAVLTASGDGPRDPYLVGQQLSYVDLSMNQVLRGLEYAFPRGFAHYASEIPRLLALREAVDALPAIAAYRSSPRCLPFNEDGIFRRYAELDHVPAAEAD